MKFFKAKIDTIKNPKESREKSRKRKRFEVEDLHADSLTLSTYSCYINRNAAGFKKPKESTDQSVLDMKITERLSWFRFYTPEEKEEERSFGVSTKLQLSINGNEDTDPWKIKKKLETSDCDLLCRLMLRKDMVHYIFKVWEDSGKIDEIAKVLNPEKEGEGVTIKVWDYERGKEYKLKFKKLSSSQSFILGGDWSNKFVNKRRLKKGDTIGLYWSTSKERFVFSVRARAPIVVA